MKYAVVNKKNEVENLIEWDGKSKYKTKGKLVKVGDEPIGVGWIHKDGKFTDPNPAKLDD